MKLRYIFHPVKLESIFTPSTVAKLTYVERTALQERLCKDLMIPGKQIVLYGHSGCGKTTLLQNLLNKHGYHSIKVSCTLETNFESLILSTIDKLDIYYEEYVEREFSSSASNQFNTELKLFKNSVFASETRTETSVQKRLVAVQLTVERLAEFLGKNNLLWIIEDFHKVPDDEKKKLAQVLKVFMDKASEYPKVKIICIGAVCTAREMHDLDPELSNRVSEIEIPLMSNDEIEKIAKKGFDLLNVKFSDSTVIEKIVYYSNRLASVCHQLCFDLCFNNKILKSQIRKVSVKAEAFLEAVKSFSERNSDTYKRIFEKIKTDKNLIRVSNSLVDKGKDSFNPNEILLGKKNKLDIPKKRELLQRLTEKDYGNLLQYNQETDTFSLLNPFLAAYLKMLFAAERAESRNKKHLELYDDYDTLLNETYFKILGEFFDKQKYK